METKLDNSVEELKLSELEKINGGKSEVNNFTFQKSSFHSDVQKSDGIGGNGLDHPN